MSDKPTTTAPQTPTASPMTQAVEAGSTVRSSGAGAPGGAFSQALSGGGTVRSFSPIPDGTKK